MSAMSRLASKNVSSKLVSNLFNQRKAGKYCDVTLKFGEVRLKAHGCVVAAFSRVVEKFMSNEEVTPGPDGGRTYSIALNSPRFSCTECATKVIEFIYIGKIQVDDHHVEHIKSVSEGLQVSELLKICKQHFDKCSMRDIGGCETPEIKTSECQNISSSPGGAEKPPLYEISTSSMGNVLDGPAAVTLFNEPASVNDDPMDESEWSGMKCPKCDIVLMSLAKYQQHCSTHLGKTYTTCCVCNYASIRVFDVIKHLQETDHCETVCSICLLQLGSNQSFKEHLQIHDQSQPFFCLTCNTRFQTRTALNSHIVRHTNETPFVCKECGRGFKWKHGLRSHMVTHSKLKSFLCDQCGFSTAHLRSFIDHKTIHSGEKFKCPKPDCQFSSVRKESVKHHLMTHSKQKPYQCEVCGQAFSQSKNLRRHATSHNPSADPEKCPFCPYQTSRSDKFKAHFKRYHKDGSQAAVKLKQKKKSSNCLSGVPENVKETAKTLAALSTSLLNTTDANGKKNESCALRKQCNLVPIDSVVSNVNDCIKETSANLGAVIALSTCNTSVCWPQDKAALCAYNSQKCSQSSIPLRNTDAELTVTVPSLNVSKTERLCVHSSPTTVHTVAQSNPNFSAVKYFLPEAGKNISNLCFAESINSVLETEVVVLSSEDQNRSNVNSVEASSMLSRPAVGSCLSATSSASVIDPLAKLELNVETDTVKDSDLGAFPCSLPLLEYQEVNDNVLVLPTEDKLSGPLELSGATNDNVIVLNADEAFSSSSPDTVFVIPDGTFIIMDIQDMSLEPKSQPNANQASI